MAKAKRSEIIQGTEKEFLDVFNRLCYSRSSWQVWADLISAIACTLSNVTDRTPKHFEAREKEYAQCIERLGSVETPAEILHIIVMALENEPEQDFLGKMYMNLNLGNHWKGQFFTPYNVCKMMSQMTVGNVDRQIEEQGYISICDPACGAGATLIAAANTLKRSKYNFQNHVLFVGQEMWYMPMFYSDIWQWRKIFHSLGSMGGTVTTEKTVEKEHFYMFFDFEEKEAQYGKQRI